MPIPPPPNTKGPDGDDILIDPPNEPGSYSRVVVLTLNDNEAPETRYEEIKQAFLSANPNFATRQITVTWLKTIREDNAAGIQKCLYRITALEEPQEVEVEFVLPSSSVPEDTPAASIGIVMTTGDGLPLKQTCAVKVKDLLTGTATSGTDYAVFPDLELVFPAGSPSGTVVNFTIGPIDDVDPEPDETVNLELFSPVNCALGGQTTHQLTINDNDVVATITARFEFAGYFEFVFFPASHTFNVVIETSDMAPTAAPASLDVSDLLTGSAIPGVDYTAFGIQPLLIPMGTVHGTMFPFVISGIIPPPFAKTINFGLGNNVGCLIGAPGTYTYMYDGTPPSP